MSVFLPFDQGILAFPTKNESWLAAGLVAVPDLEWQERLTMVQPWRPDFLAQSKAGFRCQPTFPERAIPFDGAMLQLGKHKGLNQNRFLDILERVKPGGLIIVSGDKTVGAAPMAKWVNSLAPVEDKCSKNHGIVFWLRVPVDLDSGLIEQHRVPDITFAERFSTSAGMFSHGRIDKGSAMLVPHLKNIVFGKTADFGAGWGYLACEILAAETKISTLDVFEADYHALQSAKDHIAQMQSSIPVAFHWHDLTCETVEGIYDTVISNPPFHEGRTADAALGQRFIEVAAKRLKLGGCLLLVANRHLPYEAGLKSLFRKVFVLEDAGGFKIIEARK
ncbi:class I SAM-dependent methyltransferase [Bartonella sp. LJL80]